MTREIKRSAAQAIVSVKFVYAQTKVDDTPGDKARTRSKTFETYYKVKSGPEGRHQSVERIEDALAAASTELDTGYESLFDPVFEDLRRAKVKATPNGDETLRFLRQYMILHRCDMFFADKVILIEGTAERLLLPEMVRRCAEGLLHQYVSVIEVGDAYAVRFRELLEFLDVKTLVITDIDSVSPKDQKACAPSTDQAVASNSTLKNRLPGQSSIAKLLAVDPAGKEHGHVRVAYQVPEKESGVCARSFEDAFIIANSAVLARDLRHLALKRAFIQEVGADPTAEEVEANAFAIAKRLSKHKTDFAFDVLLLDGWTVPRYIAEGLQWLA